ncbi:IS66-like element accessory protein TnpA [Curvibacter lanceolatus]|jgi:transposase|uniref:IS66-like element accessory protein TnpA n=1 Tax=Curvibacter lanceolatus TaxID=86182 RepID=UPI0004CE9C56|nr:transposase [Curvibacter lanceolatus]
MSEWISDLAQRLVVSRKRDGRCVYDEQAKRELILACQQPGISVSKVARQCGINSNQLSGWIRRHEREANDCAKPIPVNQVTIEPVPEAASVLPAFIPVKVTPKQTLSNLVGNSTFAIQATLPNGVLVDLHEIEAQQLGVVIETLGRLRCSASTKD